MRLFICAFVLSAFVLPVAECVVFSWLWSVDPLEQSSVSNHTSSRKGKQVMKGIYCRKDRQCGKGNYCHRHYGTCHKCKKIGAKCRRDHVCCKGFECVFGSCRKIVKHGRYLSKCRKDKHCKKGLCCAKTHGEFVCKPMLKENQICSFLEGGVAYAVNHGCPCDEGLSCKKLKIPKNSSKLKFADKDNSKIKSCQRN